MTDIKNPTPRRRALATPPLVTATRRCPEAAAPLLAGACRTGRTRRRLPAALIGLCVLGVGLAGALGCSSSTPQGAGPTLVADPPPNDGGAMPGAGVADHDRGVAMIEQEKYAEAVPFFDRSLQAQPKNAEAMYFRALALDKLGKREEAVQGYEKALELNDKLTHARFNLGAIYLEDPPQPDKAIKVLAPGVKQEPKDPDLRSNLAYAYFLAGQSDKAVEQYEESLKLKSDPRVHFAYAEMLFQSKRLPDAIKHYKLALPGFTKDLRHTVYIADRMARSKAFEECVLAYDTAIKLKADLPVLHVSRGLCHHGMKKSEEERADYQRAIDLDPKHQKAHFYMGMSYKESNSRGKAILWLRKTAEIDPKSPVGKKALDIIKQLK